MTSLIRAWQQPSNYLSLLLTSACSFHCDGVCRHSSCLLAILRSFRQGAVYGIKARFPHALVLTVLFGRQATVREKASAILRATFIHSRALALFASWYKASTCALNHIRGVNDNWSALIAGGLGGALVFGENTAINAQINMYVMSRVILAILRLGTQKGIVREWENTRAYGIYSGLVWATVMMLFEAHSDTLQPGLAASMTYLYRDSDKQPEDVKFKDSFVDWFIAPVN